MAKNNQKLDSIMKSVVGSPVYMAPQILKKQKYSYKCDIWSLGIMTYEMLVGKFPFDTKKYDFAQ
jgi:serine/threonine protein kinase